jgi:FkbM family methyltransferase
MKTIKLIKKIYKKIFEILFLSLAKITNTNLTIIGYKQKGIYKYGNDEITGEKFVIEKVLKNFIVKNPIFFDVGANIGSYSLSLINHFPDSKIYSFEPNPNTFKKIKKDTLQKNIKFHNIGLGSVPGNNIIYDYKNSSGTEHASIYKEVFPEIYNDDSIAGISFVSETIDVFCKLNEINKIDFLKIDTEGSEFDVLKGASVMLANNNISIIQFEFNKMNVISRVFLRDYYELLKNYNIYRITSKKLIPMPTYETENEIFQYQNLLAINKIIDTI